jgi:peptidoglycan L-alanyl-D-glutamate endopeptidase CwlK
VSIFKFLTSSAPIDPYVERFKAAAADAGIDVRITQTVRTREEQRRLYAQGRDTPGPIVTWTMDSKHIGGKAFDFTVGGAPDFEDDPEAWEIAGDIVRGLGLTWGGDWDVQDFSHAEL